MVPIGPKKGGGFVVVPLNYGGGYANPKSCMHLDKSGLLPTETSTMGTAKDVRVWVPEANGHQIEGSLTQRKNSSVTKQGYTVRLSHNSKEFSRAEIDNDLIKVNDSAEYVNFE